MANTVTQIILTAVDKTKAAFASAKAGLASIADAGSSLKSQLGSIFAGLSIVGAFGKIKTVANEIDDAKKAAEGAGTSLEKFSALTYASGQSGGGPDVLQKSLIKLGQSLKDSEDGGTAAAASWRALRLDPKQFNDSGDALLAIAARFKSMPDGINKVNLAVDLFGEKIGPRMIPLLNQGAEGIRQLMEEGRRLGKVFDDETGAAAERLNDTLDRLSATQTRLGAKALPSLEQYVSALDDIITRGSALDRIKFFGFGYIPEDTLNRISDAGKRVQDYNEEIAALIQLQLEYNRVRDTVNAERIGRQIAELDATRAKLIDAAKAAAAQEALASKDALGALEDTTKARKEAVNEQIRDAERLQNALQAAFSASFNAEREYLRQAQKLRAEANAGEAAPLDDIEAQASAKLDAILAAQKLARISPTAGLEDVQDQAELVRVLASRFEDAALKADLLRQAKLAEADALEKAAEGERERQAGLAKQQDLNVKAANELKAVLEEIGKPVPLVVESAPETKQAITDLQTIKGLIAEINASTVNPNFSSKGGSFSDELKDAAMKRGHRI